MSYLSEVEEEHRYNQAIKNENSFRTPVDETENIWNDSEMERIARKHLREIFEAKRNLSRTKTLLMSVSRMLDGLLEELETQILNI